MRLISIYEKEKNTNEIVFWTKKRGDDDYKKKFVEDMLSPNIIIMMENVSESDNLTEFTDSKEHNDPKDLIDLTEPNDSKGLIELKELTELKESIDLIKLKAITPIIRLLLAYEKKNSETRRLFHREVQS
jgi:hypothetical protein